MNIICQSLYYQYILDKFNFFKSPKSNNNNNIVLSMLYAEICPKVRRHNARPEGEYYCINNRNHEELSTFLNHSQTLFKLDNHRPKM